MATSGTGGQPVVSLGLFALCCGVCLAQPTQLGAGQVLTMASTVVSGRLARVAALARLATGRGPNRGPAAADTAA